jgi:hypothetical protein
VGIVLTIIGFGISWSFGILNLYALLVLASAVLTLYCAHQGRRHIEACLSLTDISEILGMNEGEIRRFLEGSGIQPAYKLRGHDLYSATDLEQVRALRSSESATSLLRAPEESHE